MAGYYAGTTTKAGIHVDVHAPFQSGLCVVAVQRTFFTEVRTLIIMTSHAASAIIISKFLPVIRDSCWMCFEGSKCCFAHYVLAILVGIMYLRLCNLMFCRSFFNSCISDIANRCSVE